jgi:hypothetical protein
MLLKLNTCHRLLKPAGFRIGEMRGDFLLGFEVEANDGSCADVNWSNAWAAIAQMRSGSRSWFVLSSRSEKLFTVLAQIRTGDK